MKASGTAGTSSDSRHSLFAACFGVFLALSMLKFGNPPIFESFVTTPANVLEFLILFPWPIRWAYFALGALAVFGFLVAKKPERMPVWIGLLPAAWLVWQLFATAQSIDPALSWPTLFHFTACGVCFYVGLFCLQGRTGMQALVVSILAGFILVLATGIEQKFGGLEQARQYFYTYTYPRLEHPPLEYLKKLTSTRIFGTLFYPNALAGVILLILPAVLCRIAQADRRFTLGARSFLALVVSGAALGCMVWSGSKGGWLLMLLIAVLALLRTSLSNRLKWLVLGLLVLLGLTGFGLRYAGYFRKGGTSVVARADYWHAALRIANAHPLLGTGPGTFAKPYAEIKRPESEMARLTHNDYLEQACDSGWPGCLLYSGFIAVSLARSYPRKANLEAAGAAELPDPGAWQVYTLWLGLLGWALQGLLEFGLYIPALAWPALTFAGMLLGRRRD